MLPVQKCRRLRSFPMSEEFKKDCLHWSVLFKKCFQPAGIGIANYILSYLFLKILLYGNKTLLSLEDDINYEKNKLKDDYAKQGTDIDFRKQNRCLETHINPCLFKPKENIKSTIRNLVSIRWTNHSSSYRGLRFSKGLIHDTITFHATQSWISECRKKRSSPEINFRRR